jgi:hypothetical protein
LASKEYQQANKKGVMMKPVMDLSAEDILGMDGIVVRNIPKTTTERWIYREGRALRAGETIVINHLGRKVRELVKDNALAGFIVTFCRGQGSMVQFSKKTDGCGDTIQSAYKDWLKKNATQ